MQALVKVMSVMSALDKVMSVMQEVDQETNLFPQFVDIHVFNFNYMYSITCIQFHIHTCIQFSMVHYNSTEDTEDSSGQ